MIVLFTDFDIRDPYVGQIHAALCRDAPNVPIIDLLHGAPDYDIRAAAYLLPAFVPEFPKEAVFLCVVDPGVGGPRRAVVVRADERWYVGPDNGLFSVLSRRGRHVACYEIRWRPQCLSASFHGRDLFAPVAAMLTQGRSPESIGCVPVLPDAPDWPDDLAEIIYIDHYGNAMTGTRADSLSKGQRITVKGHVLAYARTFGGVAPGQALWHANANGLAEISVNQGNAATQLGLQLGDSVLIKEA